MLSGPPSRQSNPSYFLVSVSTRKNLDLCIKHALAGFPSGEGGAWTFCEITEDDFVSFLHGAKVHNLYRVSRREAQRNPEQLLPPWEPLTFGANKKVYFPFRLHLLPIRYFEEPLVRREFAYIAENLLRRGGYSKTHFQADQTTLQNVSAMGTVAESSPPAIKFPADSAFAVRFSRAKFATRPEEVLRFREPILQSAIRRYLTSNGKLQALLNQIGLNNVQANTLEVLGEKALAEGHVDLLIKERVALGSALKIPIEVKARQAGPKDINQLLGYVDELQGECPAGVLIAENFSKKAVASVTDNRLRLVRYAINTDLEKAPTFEDICQGLSLEVFIQ